MNKFNNLFKINNQQEKDYSRLKKKLSHNLDIIDQYQGNNVDFIKREFEIGNNKKFKIAVLFIDGMVAPSVHDYIFKTLMYDIRMAYKDEVDVSVQKLYELLKQQLIPLSDVKELKDFTRLFDTFFSGDTIILIDGINKGFTIDTKLWKDRGITEPQAQTVVRGPRDSFNETIRINTMLIRRRIKDKNLIIESKTIGAITKTNVSIAYIKGIANNEVIKEVHRRLDKIEIDGILDSGYIEQLIKDEPKSLFPTINNTERPDAAAASLLDGRIVIIIDGSPFVLMVPALFPQFFQAAEDYYHDSYIATFLRVLRFLSFFLGLLTPSIYIALTTFHQEMIPTPLLISIAQQREGLPFPALIEAILMELTFEILREAGIRMPRAIGSAISIVGALILGEAAVQAGIVSSVMVIVVSLTAITTLISPAYNISVSIRILRFGFMILASIFGLFGIALGMWILLIHLCSLRSFGIPYMSPITPLNLEGQKDTFVRLPIWKRPMRPVLISKGNTRRQGSENKIKPQKK